MDYAKAIRIARALADVPQRELARRVSMDSSLISMLESGKRRPSLETLEKIADALGLPFHLFALLGTEARDAKGAKSEDIERLAVGLTKLLLRREDDGSRTPRANRYREAQHTQSKSTSAHSARRRRKTP